MPSRARGIETPSFTRGRKRRIVAYRRAKLTSRSPDANSSWWRPAPDYRNERRALAPEKRSEPRGRRRRRAGKKLPPLGEARQMDLSRVKIRPEMASPNNRSVQRVVWWLGARRHARPDEARQTRDGGLFLIRPRAILGDCVSIPPLPLPSYTLPSDAHSVKEEAERSFRAFDATSRAARVWNEGVSGVVVGLRGAHNHWHQAGGQAQLAFGSLALWTRARAGSGARSRRSFHGFWPDLTAGIPDAAHDGVGPQHPALQTARPTSHRRS
ncbi:putative retrotransposon hot spot (RHS) protein [Trypanosoma cruzi]|nr:putative retrotransposon hot spot (RHS) protein [Trypanosoma cruzi]